MASDRGVEPTILDERAPWARRGRGAWTLSIRVQPGAARTAIVGPHGDELKVRVSAPANEGKANEELVRFLAKRIGVGARDVEILSGHQARSKVVAVHRDPAPGRVR